MKYLPCYLAKITVSGPADAEINGCIDNRRGRDGHDNGRRKRGELHTWTEEYDRKASLCLLEGNSSDCCSRLLVI